MTTTATLETVAPAVPRPRADHDPIPASRLVAVELRKMFDTRSGFWLMASLVVLSVAATAATIIFVDADNLDYEGFASAWGMPMSVILPMIAVLAVTSEWSARSALTTFTLVPGRGRVIAAKAAVTAAVGVVAIAVAAAVGALGSPGSYDELPYFFTDQYDLGMEYVGHAPDYDSVVFRGDVGAREFTAFWLDQQARVRAGMNVNIWDGLDDIKALIRSGERVDAARLADPQVPLAALH